MPELPDVGDEFAGYLLQSVIGRGGMSVVYEAEHPQFGHGIALKVLAAQVAADGIFRMRFLDESRIAAAMDHPHVIPVYDVGEADGLLYIAMRRVAGGNLRQRIATGGPLPPQAAVALLGQAAQALDAAHRMGLVHRDVKPENLLIEGGDDPGSAHLYLADFGISRLGMKRNGLTSTGQFLGTIDYVAPEQLSEPYVYGSADQYSLGCVLYECLTGRVPFEKGADRASTPRAPRTELPPAVDEMFARVLAERPGDRYNICREFIDAASVAVAGLATEPSSGVESNAPQPAPEPASAPEPSHPAASAPGDDQPEPPSASAVDQPEPAESSGSGTGRRRRRARWLVIAAVLLLVCAGAAGAYAALSAQPKASASMPTAMASKPTAPRVSLLTQVLTAADASKVAMGMLPPSACTRGVRSVVCTAPAPSISRVTFTTYPTLSALYSAYQAAVRSLNSGRYRQNVQNCGLSAPSPYGEVAWNHREQHSRAYTIREMIAGRVSVESAMGRMACLATARHSEDIVWTTDYGKMLGVAIGRGSHRGVWLWWIAVHHNIVFPGTPMDMSDKSVSLMVGAPMPTSSASAAPSMATSAAASMAASPSPSMPKAAGKKQK